MKALILVAVLLVPASAIAQDKLPTPTSRRAPSIQNQPARAAQRPAPAKAAPAQLPENVVLHWQGSFQGMVELDVHLTGCGPEFRTEFTLPSGEHNDLPPTIFTIRAIVIPSGERYRVDYTMGARIPVKTGGQQQGAKPVPTNIEFREVLNSGAVIVSPGTPVVLSKLGERTLTFTLAAAE